MKIKKVSLVISLVLLFSLALSACSNSAKNITVSGSTSMESLVKALGEAYLEKTGNTVDVQPGGSGAGIDNVKKGVSQIGNVSRNLKDTEKSEGYNEYTVAIDGIAVIVNPENGITNLTKDQIVKIFTGEITNFKDLGGEDAEIVVVGREQGSGTRDGFESVLDIAEKAKYKSELNETGEVKNLVATTKNAIGYISLGYVDDTVKALSVDGITPSESTVQDQSYSIQRPFIMITAKEENADAKEFINYILSDEGQEIVSKKGYVAVK